MDNQNFSEEDREDADFIIERMEAYIKGTTNPLVQVVELLGRKQSAHESCEKFIEDLKERARWCEFGRVVDVQNWFLLSCLCANMYDSEIRAEVIFKKDLTFENAVEFVLEKEKAAKASRELEQRKGGAEVCATSSYRSGKVGQAQQRWFVGFWVRCPWSVANTPVPRQGTVAESNVFEVVLQLWRGRASV